MGGGGGGGGEQQKAPDPMGWWYDANGQPTEYRSVYEALPSDRYRTPQAADEANPKVYLYDAQGTAAKRIFEKDAKAGNYDTTQYNLGPDAVAYRYWYDKYGVQQVYAPETTPLGEGYYDSPTKAPDSPNFKAAVSFDQVDPAYGKGATSVQDLAANKVRSQKRKSTNDSLLQDITATSSTTDGGGGGKTLLGG